MSQGVYPAVFVPVRFFTDIQPLLACVACLLGALRGLVLPFSMFLCL